MVEHIGTTSDAADDDHQLLQSMSGQNSGSESSAPVAVIKKDDDSELQKLDFRITQIITDSRKCYDEVTTMTVDEQNRAAAKDNAAVKQYGESMISDIEKQLPKLNRTSKLLCTMLTEELDRAELPTLLKVDDEVSEKYANILLWVDRFGIGATATQPKTKRKSTQAEG